MRLQWRTAGQAHRRLLAPPCTRVTQPRSRTAIMRSSAAAARTAPTPEVLKTLREAEAFAFDVDSTFCEDESIDELAAYLGVGDQVAALTAKAMGGSVDFKTALTTRLDVMQPSRQQVDQFLAAHPHKVSKGIPELLSALRRQGKQVFLVSGGFRQIIHPLAEQLDIPVSNVFANSILFDGKGKYVGFDEAEFTCRSGGKPAALRYIKEKRSISNIVMVGDGATDMEARLEGVASLFIGYGGVVVRENIAAKADWYVMDIHQIVDALQ